MSRSFFSSDIYFDFLLDDFQKRVAFIYQNIFEFYEIREFNLRSYYLLKKFHMNNFLFFNSDVKFLSNFYIRSKDIFRSKAKFIIFDIPVKKILMKLRFLGYLHLYKIRPVGNVNFLSCEDWFIIKSFGFLAYSFTNWFRFCTNISRVNYIVELIRQSCFLTLARKHNKSKNWVYSVYTPRLVLSKGLFFKESFFPDKNFVSKYDFDCILFEILYYNSNWFLEKY